ncbi:MAG: hypothetical protein KAU94_03105, partial [Verrucomicrobia bacterium]|nr:hypothetical protein [Verrucomicrobiota bacterium]
VDSESGSVVNGSLIVVKGTQVGVATGASGSLDLTTYTAGTDADNTQVGAADNASGSLVAGSGAITGNSLDVGTGSGSVGTLDMGTGSLSFDNATMIGGATSASGTVDAASFTLSGNSDLTIGSSSNAYGRLTASNGSVASAVLSIASGQDSVGTLDMGSGTVTVGDTVNIATGQDSTATVTLGSAMVLASTNGLFVGTGAGSSQNLTASDFSVSGPIGDFGVGEGTGASLKGLFSLHETIGSVTVNSPLELTAGSHTILGLMLAGGTGTTGSLALSGSASVILTNTIDIASGDGSSASLDLADLVTGDHVAGTINVGRGDQSVGSLTYTAGNLLVTAAAGMEVGTSGNGSDATVLLKSLSGGSILSICQNSGVSAPTGTVTVLENASNGTVRVARALNSVGTLTVGGTLTAGQYLNSAGLESNAVGRITAATLNKTGTGSTQVAQGVNTDGSIIASNGTLLGNLYVATANGSLGLFAVTNGMASPTILQIATGDGSDGTVLVGITSPATNDVVIGTGSNAIGRLTLPAGTLTAADLTLGGAGTGAGTITVAGGDLVVTGAVSAVNSSFIDVTDDASTFTWTGRVEADFIALWDAGTLRRDGESGLTAATFSDYFQVSGDVLSASTSYPIGTIVITGPIAGGGMIISWDTTLGQSYDVQTNGNLIIPNWNVYDTVVGDGGGMSVTSATAQAELFYKVTSD